MRNVLLIHVILSCHILGGRGIEGGVVICSYLEWLTCLFLLLMVEFKSYYTARQKVVLIFLVTKVFQKVTVFKWIIFMFHSHMRFYVTQWSGIRFYGSLIVCNRPLPLKKVTPWQPSENHLLAILVLFEIRLPANPPSKS